MIEDYPDYKLGGYGRIDQDEFFENQRDAHDTFLEFSSRTIVFIVIVYGVFKLFGWL